MNVNNLFHHYSFIFRVFQNKLELNRIVEMNIKKKGKIINN